MALVSNTDVYSSMLEAGATKKEAAAVALGSTLGMFSVDKYPKPTPGTADVLGKEKCGKFKGYFDSTKSPAIMPDEFENLMLKYKFHKQYDPTNTADLAEIN